MTTGTTPSPRVSGVLCTYNGERFLPELLESLAAQTIPVDRIVLRDNGSTDDCEAIVRARAFAWRVELVHATESTMRMGPARSFLTELGAGRGGRGGWPRFTCSPTRTMCGFRPRSSAR